MFKFLRKNSIGLVLSGGGTRGIAHIGVLKALEDYNIKIDAISGVSAGAIIGAFYADGWKPDDIYDLFHDKSFFDFSNVIIPSNGFLTYKGLRKKILNKISVDNIEDLKIPYYCAAVDLNNMKIVYFDKGDLKDRVIASSSIPVLFAPSIIDGISYVDGGVLDNLPIAPLKNEVKFIISSNTNHLEYKDKFESTSDIIMRVIHIGVNRSVLENKKNSDLLIEPEEIANFNILNSSGIEEMYEIGYEYAKKVIADSKFAK